ncbi:ABC transporter ATP-binding protein [archaeon]|nr:MAG: ABC transporter ATP-binding protein [archaeon]RLG66066.1 MAG: ABC transporter ATP-binding protein [archaeon]HDM24104.1 ABC transporter ATP-binding protein [Candidatus Bathyarchaeota archaeon]
MIVEVEGLTFTYAGKREPALRDVELGIDKGELVLLVGRSGSGKSTLLKCINGLIPNRYQGAYRGEVRVNGIVVQGASLTVLSRVVGTVLQEVGKQLVLSKVEDDVAFGPCNLCLPRREIKRRVYNALERVDALHLKDRDVNELSGGEKQRVAIAGVLALDPPVILMDEPMANLDSEGVKLVQCYIKELRERGKTVVVAEHRAEEILEVGVDRIVILDRGRIVEETEDEEVLKKYTDVIKVPARLFKKPKMGQSIKVNASREDIQGPVVVKFENVYFSYDDIPALKGVSLEIREGERIALLGNNGAGKSTLAKLMLGLIKPTRGRVIVYGMDTREKEVYELAPFVGLVFQDPFNMLFAPTVREELSYGPRNLGVNPDEINRRVEETAQRCGVHHLLNYSPFASSHGEKKRICVSSILTMMPRILILDEPTAGQDYASYTAFMNFIQRLKGRVRTLILITHDTDLAIEYSDRTIILADGKVIADGPTREILANREYLKAGRIRETSLVRVGRELTEGGYVLKFSELKRLCM